MEKKKRKINRSQKEKRRKKVQKELARKPHFKSLFVRYLLLTVVVAALLSAVGTFVARTIYVSECRNRINTLTDNGQSAIQVSYDEVYSMLTGEEYAVQSVYVPEEDRESVSVAREDIMKYLPCRLNYRVDVCSTQSESKKSMLEEWLYGEEMREEGYIAIYDGDELVVDSEENVYSLMRMNSPVDVYTLLRADGRNVMELFFYRNISQMNVEKIEEAYPGLIDKIGRRFQELRKDTDNEYYWNCGGSSVYRKHDVFIPEYIGIYKSRDKEAGWTTEDELIERYDLSDVDVKGYLYQNVREEESMFWNYYLSKTGCEKEGIQCQYYHDNVQSVYGVEELWDETFFGVDCVTGKDVKVGTIELTMVVTGSYNLFREYGRILVFAYACVLAVAIVTALLISYRSYLQRQARYEIEVYRRNTTNAMAHDLKSPLMAISAYAENLVNGVNPGKNEYYGESILDTVNYMDQLIANILNLSKIENSSVCLNWEMVDIKELLEMHLPKYALLLKERNLQISINGECEQYCDRAWMTQLIENLLSNAVRYASNDSSIGIQLTGQSLLVMNHFEGTLDKSPEELTESFVKGDNARSNQGTGIGLAIVENVVRAHGFELELQVEGNVFIAKITF